MDSQFGEVAQVNCRNSGRIRGSDFLEWRYGSCDTQLATSFVLVTFLTFNRATSSQHQLRSMSDPSSGAECLMIDRCKQEVNKPSRRSSMQLEMSRKGARTLAQFLRPYWLLAFVLGTVSVISIPTMAQGVRGTITGQVTDQAGAVIPGASV